MEQAHLERHKLAKWVNPGDVILGRQVMTVEVDGPAVTIVFDEGDTIHVHVDDQVVCDLPGKDATWMRFEPQVQDGVVTGWTLVLDMDSDWQRWSINAESGKQEFRLDLNADDMQALAMAATLPITLGLIHELEREAA